jgi:hypothetical protein
MLLAGAGARDVPKFGPCSIPLVIWRLSPEAHVECTYGGGPDHKLPGIFGAGFVALGREGYLMVSRNGFASGRRSQRLD